MKHRISFAVGIFMALLLLVGCGEQNDATKQSSKSSQAESSAKSSSQAKKTDISTLPLIGKWKSTNGMTFTFGNDGKWTYQATSGSTANGTFQLAGAYQQQLLLKLHGLDQEIGGIGNYLGMKLTQKNKKLYIVGFGQFELEGVAKNMTQSAQTEMTGIFNSQPKTTARLLVGTWMDTDENSVTQLTTNFDPDGSYQRYNGQTRTVETGKFTVSKSNDDANQLVVKLTSASGTTTTENYQVNSAYTQLTRSENKINTVYVKNQMPDNIN